MLLTFTIDAPERFVFAISAPDFDQVCQASALDAIRTLVRTKRAGEILDLSSADTTALQSVIGAASTPYGVVVQRVVIIHVQPPLEFMASLESRRLASVRLDEQTEQHALEERLLADRESLGRQRVAHQRERIELEAANEALRLQNLESRLAAYPNAARRDIEEQRIEVARALAGNTRAMVQVGGNGDVADALIMHTLTDTPPTIADRGAYQTAAPNVEVVGRQPTTTVRPAGPAPARRAGASSSSARNRTSLFFR